MPLLQQLHKEEAVKGLKLSGEPNDTNEVTAPTASGTDEGSNEDIAADTEVKDPEQQQQEASKTPSLPKRRKQIGGGTKDWVKAIQCKWLAKIKTDKKGEPSVYKSRLVAKGFQQKEKEDYKEVFAPTAKSPMLCVLLALAAVRKWKVKQMDIVTAFLYGIVEEEVYMVQPPGYENGTGRVCKLNKAIYGLKQAPRCCSSDKEIDGVQRKLT
ncbi:hypothetical protein CLOM_g21279 [Closterium sp. NIES-68]|nr:hypothetical protein CLOM_g21279 [Closterium sp. NIES-68]